MGAVRAIQVSRSGWGRRLRSVRRRYHLHLPGIAYLLVVILVGFSAINRQLNLLFWVFGVLIALLAISGLVSGLMMMGIRVRRLDPQHGSVGEPMSVRYAVRNASRLLPTFNIHIEELDAPSSRWRRLMRPSRAWIMHVGAREAVHGEAVFWPRARGQAKFGRVRIWTTFPFGLVKKSITIEQPQHTLIYPRLYELKPEVLRAIMPEGPAGMKVSTRAGSGDDYFGMREYRVGDPMHHIAWKRSACLDQLVLIERTRPSPPKVRIVLDLSIPTDELQGDDDSPAARRLMEEQAISLAASIALLADHAGFEVGLTVWGVGVPPIPLRRNHWHLSKILGALAGISLDGPREPRRAAMVADAERAGLVAIHPDRVRPGGLRADAWHLTARQLDGLAQRPIGWDPAKQRRQEWVG